MAASIAISASTWGGVQAASDLRAYLTPLIKAETQQPIGLTLTNGLLTTAFKPQVELLNRVEAENVMGPQGELRPGASCGWTSIGFFPIGSWYSIENPWSTPERLAYSSRLPGPSPVEWMMIPYSTTLGNTLERIVDWECDAKRWTLADTYTFGYIVRRKGLDGSEFEAVPMKVTRNGEPWETIYFGYRLGPIEARGNWSAESLTRVPELSNWPVDGWPGNNEVALKSLPPPWIEGEVTEYRNTVDFPKSPYGQFFYAARDEDRDLLDTQTNWKRTGRSFYSGGYVGVCRFYGSMNPGPNTHFFTASAEECEYFKNLQKTPTPTDVQQLNYEGQSFRASLPIINTVTSESGVVTQEATCPMHSMPLYRAYNNAYSSEGKRDYDSNHRFSTKRSDMDVMTLHGWTNEGIVMCVPTADAQRVKVL